MLYGGEHVGCGTGPRVDIAIDPVDGAGLTAKSLPNAMSVIALADRGAMFDPGPCVYMDKLVVGADLADAGRLRTRRSRTPWRPSPGSAGRASRDVTVALLDRPRHVELVAPDPRRSGRGSSS